MKKSKALTDRVRTANDRVVRPSLLLPVLRDEKCYNVTVRYSRCAEATKKQNEI